MVAMVGRPYKHLVSVEKGYVQVLFEHFFVHLTILSPFGRGIGKIFKDTHIVCALNRVAASPVLELG